MKAIKRFMDWLAGPSYIKVRCQYCRINIIVPEDEIYDAVQSHIRHPAHRAAQRRREENG